MTALHVALNPLPCPLLTQQLLWKVTVIFLPELVIGLGFRKVHSIHLSSIYFSSPFSNISSLQLLPIYNRLGKCKA